MSTAPTAPAPPGLARVTTSSPGLVTAAHASTPATSEPTPFVAAMRAPPGAALTTFTIFQYPPGAWLWALRLMGTGRRSLARTPGIGFHRLLGSGAGLGFSLLPDLSRYAMLATWSSEQAADDFFAASPRMAACRAHARDIWTVKLIAHRSRGSWAGRAPFAPTLHPLPPGLPTVVLTRATLRLRSLLRFWGRVPAINRDLVVAPGMRLALGVGELPWFRPVTFSVWDDEQALTRFAYAGSHHHAAARAAQDRDWFREDLFTRFTAIATQGQLAGRDPCGLSGPKDMSLGPAALTAS